LTSSYYLADLQFEKEPTSYGNYIRAETRKQMAYKAYIITCITVLTTDDTNIVKTTHF